MLLTSSHVCKHSSVGLLNNLTLSGQVNWDVKTAKWDMPFWYMFMPRVKWPSNSTRISHQCVRLAPRHPLHTLFRGSQSNHSYHTPDCTCSSSGQLFLCLSVWVTTYCHREKATRPPSVLILSQGCPHLFSPLHSSIFLHVVNSPSACIV